MTRPDDLGLHVKQVYSDDYFYSGNSGYPNYLYERELLIQHGRRYGKIVSKYIKKPGKVLDVGSAAGFILKGLVDYGWEGYGVEPNDSMAKYAREAMGVRVHTRTIESFETKIQYDLICFIQVIAHLVDPYFALMKACSMLSNRGYILVETWNWKSWTARLLGKHWHVYSPPSVLHFFSPKSLSYLMNQFGLDLIATGHPFKRITWKHAKSVMLYKIGKIPISHFLGTLFRVIPDSFLIRYPCRDLFWSLYKRNLNVLVR